MSQFVELDEAKSVLYCKGQWVLSTLAQIEQDLTKLKTTKHKKFAIDGSQLAKMDSGGALLICQLQSKSQMDITLANFSKSNQQLLDLTLAKEGSLGPAKQPVQKMDFISRIGKHFIDHLTTAYELLSYIGELTNVFKDVFILQRDLQWKSLMRTIEEGGWRALPILALLSFLIGVVLAYQLGLQLQNYGANIYIVNLTGMAILREFGPLLTAIIVAGRTGSAFTAQIGLMKVNEEIDALSTMGLSPANRIAIPRILGIVIAMPLLTIWSNAFGVLGSMFMSENMLAISMTDFISRFSEVIELSNLWTGIAKTPVFGLAIGTIGCFQGFKVSYTAESIGERTTISVVQSLFLIIVIDATFSVLYSWAKL